MKLEVGQKLYFVPSYSWAGSERVVEVVKVGRSWVTVSDGRNEMRIDKETCVVDGKGYASPGKCWSSKEELEQHTRLLNAWDKFRRFVEHRWGNPPSLDIGELKEVALKLGMDQEQVEKW